MLKPLMLAILVLGTLAACSYRETKTVQAPPPASSLDAPAGSTTTTTTTKLGF